MGIIIGRNVPVVQEKNNPAPEPVKEVVVAEIAEVKEEKPKKRKPTAKKSKTKKNEPKNEKMP